jgi:histidine triad (HIT) family protein
MEGECVFCDLGNGPKEKRILDDKACFVMLDKYPADYGHMLVISKTHYVNLIDASEADSARMFSVAKRMAERAVERLDARGANVTTNVGRAAGQIVNHFHIHVIPRYPSGPRGDGHRELEADAEKELISKLK